MKADAAESVATSSRASELPVPVAESRSSMAPSAELVEEFRARLGGSAGLANGVSQDKSVVAPGTEGKAQTHPATAAAADEAQWQSMTDHAGNGMSWGQAAAQAAPSVTTDVAPAMAGNAAALAALLERHVRTLLVSADGLDRCGAQMLFRLDGDALGGTDLVLTRTGEGWLLEANTQSQSVLDSIRESAGDLEQRFESHGIGLLDVRAALRNA